MCFEFLRTHHTLGFKAIYDALKYGQGKLIRQRDMLATRLATVLGAVLSTMVL